VKNKYIEMFLFVKSFYYICSNLTFNDMNNLRKSKIKQCISSLEEISKEIEILFFEEIENEKDDIKYKRDKSLKSVYLDSAFLEIDNAINELRCVIR
jgi:hypothetical protein